MCKRINSLILPAFLACLGWATAAHAGVCFVVGGDCGELNAVKEEKNCPELGYKYATNADCQADNPMYGEVDKSSAMCTQDRTPYYQKCKCDTSVYKWTAENIGDSYLLVEPKCHDNYGDHYKYRKCNTSLYSKIKHFSTTGGIVPAVCTPLSSSACHQNSTPTDECVEDQNYLESSASINLCSSYLAKRYKKCVCNTSTYKYLDSSSAISHKVDGDECFGTPSSVSSVIDVSGKDPFITQSTVMTFYSGIKCSGTTTASGTWRESCNSDEKSTQEKTIGGLTCKLCVYNPCDTGWGLGEAPDDGKYYITKQHDGTTCHRLATCDDIDHVALSGGSYTGNATISSSSTTQNGYTTPSSTYNGSVTYYPKSGYTLSQYGLGQSPLTLTSPNNGSVSLAINDTCYWAKAYTCDDVKHIYEKPFRGDFTEKTEYRVGSYDTISNLSGYTSPESKYPLGDPRSSVKLTANSIDDIIFEHTNRICRFGSDCSVTLKANDETCYWAKEKICPTGYDYLPAPFFRLKPETINGIQCYKNDDPCECNDSVYQISGAKYFDITSGNEGYYNMTNQEINEKHMYFCVDGHYSDDGDEVQSISEAVGEMQKIGTISTVGAEVAVRGYWSYSKWVNEYEDRPCEMVVDRADNYSITINEGGARDGRDAGIYVRDPQDQGYVECTVIKEYVTPRLSYFEQSDEYPYYYYPYENLSVTFINKESSCRDHYQTYNDDGGPGS